MNLKLPYTLFLICTFAFLGSLKVGAQVFHDPIEQSLADNDITKLLLPLNDLLDSAILHSPLLMTYDADLKINQLQILLEKRTWMKNIGVEAGAKYGLFDNLILQQDLGVDNITTSSTEQTRYYFGVFLKMPISIFFDKSNLNTAKLESEKLLYQRANTERELRKLVVTLYGNLLKAHKGVIIKSAEVEAYRVQIIRAEKEYENGIISTSDYTRFKDMMIKVQIGLEETKVELFTAIHILQETIGVNPYIKN